METAAAARGGRRENLSLRQRASARTKRRDNAFDAAFESFYRRHVADIYQYSLAVLGNSTDAEDVTQQTFLNAYRAFQRGERPQKEHNWLIKIAHNVCRMRWRQSSRRPQELPLELAREPVAPEADPTSLDEVLAALAELPFNQRAAIVMREVEDRSYAEIAEVLGTTVPAVEALLFRARTNLRARRKALAGALSVVPVPGSLSSFFGGGSGGLLAAGGIAAGSELALKIAAIVTAGAVAGGLGYKTVDALGTSDPVLVTPAAEAASAAVQQPSLRLAATSGRAIDIAAFRHPARRKATQGELRSVGENDQLSAAPTPGAAPAAAPAAGAAPAAAAVPGQGVAALGSPVSPASASSTVGGVVGSVPSQPTPTTPAVSVPVSPPSLPVPPPPLPTPTVPPVPVSVPTVTLPPLTK
jgi:RNA polymerase sigma-70 factor (ECF subfamily)